MKYIHACICTHIFIYAHTVEHSHNKQDILGQTVCHKQEFVISEQFPTRYCSTWLRSLLCYIKKFVIEEFFIRVFHCTYLYAHLDIRRYIQYSTSTYTHFDIHIHTVLQGTYTHLHKHTYTFTPLHILYIHTVHTVHAHTPWLLHQYPCSGSPWASCSSQGRPVSGSSVVRPAPHASWSHSSDTWQPQTSTHTKHTRKAKMYVNYLFAYVLVPWLRVGSKEKLCVHKPCSIG